MRRTVTPTTAVEPRGGRSASSPLVEKKWLPLVARLLTGPTLRQILRTGLSAYVASALRDAGVADALGADASLVETASAIFEQLRKHYRNDYVYRSAITKKVFLGRHSPTTTVLLPELRVWRSKADLVMLNGTSVAYEIKTELDKLDRLTSQLEAYSRMFDKIYVVTDERLLDRVRAETPDYVGMIVLSSAFTLRVMREASSNADRVHVPTIIDALRLGELTDLTKRICGRLPDSTSVQMFAACARLLEDASPRAVHDAMVSILKRRRAFGADDFRPVPDELLSAYVESGIDAAEWPALTERLTSTTLETFLDAHI